jgi:hypothetical protein
MGAAAVAASLLLTGGAFVAGTLTAGGAPEGEG